MTTIGTNPDCPGGIQLLADHLDTALAVGEDLLALVLPPRADLDEADPETAPEAIGKFVKRLSELEIALLVRVLQARRRAGEIGRSDAMLKPAASLFQAQTALLVDLIESTDRQQSGGLGGGGDELAYLRSRGLLAPEAAAPSPYESIAVSEDFRIGGIVALGTMLDLVSALLDLLDTRFGLYAVVPDGDVMQPVAIASETPEADLSVIEPGEKTEDDETVVAVGVGQAAGGVIEADKPATGDDTTANSSGGLDKASARVPANGGAELERPV